MERTLSPNKPPEKILFVDDEAAVLDSFKRQLRGKFDIDTALGPAAAQQAIQNDGPYAVIVSDMKMPGMNGAQLLAWARGASPESVRMILTGFADMDSAVKAVNEGNVYRFLTKPCDAQTLIRALIDAIRQYRLEIAERQILEQTLQGAIKVLTDMLALVKPEAFGRASRISRHVREIAAEMALEQPWQYETAAMLSQIGCLALPDDLLYKVYKGKPLSRMESEEFRGHPAMAAELLDNIPRLEPVSQAILYQEKQFDGYGPPEGGLAGHAIPLGGRILKVVLDFDSLSAGGLNKAKGLVELKKRHGWYDPDLLLVLEETLGMEAKYNLRQVDIVDLEENMILSQDICAGSRVLLARGQQLSRTLIVSLRNYHRAQRLAEPVEVLVPIR